MKKLLFIIPLFLMACGGPVYAPENTGHIIITDQEFTSHGVTYLIVRYKSAKGFQIVKPIQDSLTEVMLRQRLIDLK